MGSKTCIGIIGIMVTVIMGLSGYFVGANAEQDRAIEKKAERKELIELEEDQEKAHDKIDIKFDRVLIQITETNLRLQTISTQLEERTQ